MRILFCGGGTAGHVNPAIAVAQTLLRNNPENKVAYVATENGIENHLVEFKKYHIDVVGFKRKVTFKNFSFFIKQIKAVKQCEKIIEEFHPNIIFGTGGFATYPVITAGKKLGIKTIIHESNAVPGKAILALEKKVDKILVNFEESKKYFKCKDKIICVGNPLRSGFEIKEKAQIKKELNIKQKYVVLCMSGSLGAERMNNSSIELMDNLIKYREDIFFVFSTGKNEYENTVQKIKNRGLEGLKNVLIQDYFSNIYDYIAASDIVISRAGAMSISELASMKKATILVPSPNVTNNHQFINAKTLEKANSAILISENRLYTLVDTVKDLISNEKKRTELETAIGNFAKNDANKEIYNLIMLL